MKRKLFTVALALGIVVSLVFIWDNQRASKKEKVYTSGDINLPNKGNASTNEKPAQIIVAQPGGLAPQVADEKKDSNSDQIKTHMDSYQAKLIQKAEMLIDRAKSIPSGIDPVIETKGDFTVVFWPIPRQGGNMVPGPSNYAAVHFRRGTLDVEGVLGAH